MEGLFYTVFCFVLMLIAEIMLLIFQRAVMMDYMLMGTVVLRIVRLKQMVIVMPVLLRFVTFAEIIKFLGLKLVMMEFKMMESVVIQTVLEQ